MSSSPTASPRSVDKSLALLVQVIEGGAFPSMSALARAADLPVSTVHRLLAGLEQAGFVARLERGHYVGGPTLRRLARRQDDSAKILAQIGGPILARLSRRTGRICHLGILEENMMTYLVKEGDAEDNAVSRLGMQLEAYCTGLGKALLAHLPENERELFVAGGGFVALTPSTLTTPSAFRDEFARIRERGYALDQEEMVPGLVCIAVPIRAMDRVVAAISLVVTQSAEPRRPTSYLGRLHAAAREIETRLHPFADMLVAA
ncbi:IclR family transcriptional regulator [Rhizorhabdus dicambivorans]|uniref:IclR family transcriptional regulator n=1 Tax=Rhizorhabdus dicambivorans TaxID=1850238 RepID=A0A2A4FSI8_9SPHN|nr:IclR family transcriptional regulator [Rhizorhabdus dicambivorans]ATE63821.1 IclR family transcriptional regulator [Rhizorhabdus dicambivorans]PCE40656.1 IclR family transcriptional regulator [Rhizorhabdus dicambivorans]